MTFAILTARLLNKKAALRQDQTNSLKKQYKLTDEQIEKCNSYDPSPKNTYTGWLCKAYAQTTGTDEEREIAVAKLKAPLVQFMKLCNNPEFPGEKKDIGKYTTPELLNLVGNQRRYLKQLSPKAIEKLVKTEGLPGAKVIWNNGGFRMWYVTNSEYAMILGSGTHWCTANTDYSETYVVRGGLYTIYMNGKPFLQGHAWFNGSNGEVAFLNVDDNNPDFLDPDVMRAFEVIQHPIMAIFKRKCDVYFKNLVESMSVSEFKEKKNEIINYAQNSNTVSLIGPIVRRMWWEDGWEMLIDSPTFLIEALENLSEELKAKLRKTPLASDIASICLANKETRLAIELGDDTFLKEYVKKAFQLKVSPISSGDFSVEQRAKIAEEGVRQVNELTSPLSASDTLSDLNYFGLETVLAYWKKFINRKWDNFDRYLKNKSEEYVKRIELLQPILKSLKNLKKGDTVSPGPDCPSEFKSGIVTNIGGITIEIKDKEGKLSTFIQDNDRGVYQLMLLESTVYSPMVDYPSTLEIGQIVVNGYVGGHEGEEGEIIRYDEKEDSYLIQWNGGDQEWQPYHGQGAGMAPAVPSTNPRAFVNWEPDDSEIEVGDLITAKEGMGTDDAKSLRMTAQEVLGVKGDIVFFKWGRGRNAVKKSLITKVRQKKMGLKDLNPQPVTLEDGARVRINPDHWPYGDQWKGQGPNEPTDDERDTTFGTVEHGEERFGHEGTENTTYYVHWPNSNGREGMSGVWDYHRYMLIAVG